MKSIVIYYSQTGNTRKIARAIYNGMRQVAEACEISTVKNVDPKDLSNYDLIGLGSPVWMGGETPNVRLFLENVPRQNGTHIFSFNTHGVMPEHYFPSMVRRLKAKGFTVIGTRDWYGAYYSQLAPVPYFTEGHPDEIDLREAEDFGRQMVEKSGKIAAGDIELIPQPPSHAYTPQLHVLLEFYQSGHNPHGHITFDKEKCLYPKCTICIDNCPMGYINLASNPPVFGSTGKDCDMWMGCTFCEMICPTGAINGDWEERLQRREPSTIMDFNPLEKAADEAIASGRLRMLVPREKVRFDNPYVRVHNKRPRFKIPQD